MTRIIAFSGKGGSGVSTLAAATGVAIAAAGRSTLVFGLGPGLGHALDTSLPARPARVGDNLLAFEGRQRRGSKDEFRDWLQQVLDWRGMEAELAEDLTSLPGMNHVGLLLELEACASSGDYDVIVVDGAPLNQFLDLPAALDAAARWLERLFAPRQPTVFEPFLRVFAGDYATAGDDVLDRGRLLLGRLAQLRDLLTDADKSSVRLVLAAEGARLDDAEQAMAALSLFAYPVDALVLNRMLPDQVTDPFFDAARREHAELLQRATQSVRPMPVLSLAALSAAPRGPERLSRLARDLYGEEDPARVLHRWPPQSLSRQDDQYILSLPLPFARREELSLEQTDDGVAVRLDGRRCLLALPREVRDQEAVSWAFEKDVLTVVFR